jgi:transglutaminase-like putative cysteine protease
MTIFPVTAQPLRVKGLNHARYGHKRKFYLEHIDKKYLQPTSILDCDNEAVIQFAGSILDNNVDPVAKAVMLYYAVRDMIWYDPYYPFYLPEHYRASNIIKSRRGFCIHKAALLCALGRVCGIPARIGFANVRNHLSTRQLLEYMGTDVFAYHGFTEFYLEGKWVRATPAFNKELCLKHNVMPLEFNGREDSIFHAYNNENKPFMEYLEYLGTYADVPVDDILEGWGKVYGKDHLRDRIAEFEKVQGRSCRDFEKEDVIKE